MDGFRFEIKDLREYNGRRGIKEEWETVSRKEGTFIGKREK